MNKHVCIGLCPYFFFLVENLAWSGRTWVNDIRHQWSGWHYGRAGLAVDGSLNTSLPRCAVLDNFSVDEPVWMVDLGTREDVKGIVVVTWQGDGQDNQTLYRDYVFGLDKLSAYVELRPRLSELPDNRECGTVTRLNNAVFRERVHIECPQPIRGRYVYLRGTGVANRWHRLFSIVLCEVLVY